MLAKSDLQELVGYDGDASVLSLYVATDLARQPKDGIMLAVRDRLKRLGSTPPGHLVERVQRFLDYEYDWQSRGVAIFAAGDGLWKTVPLPVPVTTQAYYTQSPYVRVLTDLMDRFTPYVVALVDRTSLRLFTVSAGTIHSETEAVGEQLKRHKQGGWSATKYQRREDNLALHNLKQAVEVMRVYCEEKGCGRLVLAGSQEVLAQVKELMPPPLREQVIGEVPAGMDAAPNEILDRSLELMERIVAEEERALVSDVVTAATKGGNGVIGLADALYALQQGRVRELLVAEGYTAPGYVCPACGYVAAEASPHCPFCSHEGMEGVEDAVNRAIHKAVQTGADVNIIRENPELEAAGHIAAVLRY